MTQDIFILGSTGNVGRTLLKQIIDCGDTNGAVHETPTRIVGVAAHNRFKYKSQGLHTYTLSETDTSFNQLIDLLALLEPKPITFIDATAVSANMASFHYAVRQHGHNIVTANKNPLVECNFATFRHLTRNTRQYGYRCSVMAGAEAVDYIRDLRDLGDLPTEISGCFSGTLGYICSQLETGKAFSEIVRTATKLGYTEPHPIDDLSGHDVARKMCILARTAGYDIGMEDIQVTPFIPITVVTPNVPDFLKELEAYDVSFEQRVQEAKATDNVLRYVAKFEHSNHVPLITISLQAVPRFSPLGSLQGSLNKIVIKTPTQGDIPYSVEAQGAGLAITARNIRRDLLTQLTTRTVRD